MKKFIYGKAEADLYESGAIHPDEIYEYRSEKGFDDFMRENGLDPEKYKTDDSSGSSGSPNVDEGCFLTTACVISKGLPDDCDELQTLRAYRDGYLSGRPGGREDIAHYYDIAPKIVNAVNRTTYPSRVWEDLYNELVLPCVRYIKDGHNDEAYGLYRKITLRLENEYLI